MAFQRIFKKAKVDRAKANVEAAKQRLADLAEQPSKGKSRSVAEKKVLSAKKELYRSEQELSGLSRQPTDKVSRPG